MKRLLNNWPLLLIASLCILSRLPQLLSPELLLDGDECVTGLMAKHFIEGTELPIFFHGQAYGFAFIETSFVSLFYLLFGINDICVKLPMLLMWTAGILFFYKTLTAISTKNKWLPLLITLIFIFAPSWALWSMKARGGYLTSFFFSSLLMWIVFRKKGINSYFTYFFIGLVLVIIYQSQPLWLPGLLPIILYKLYPRLNRKRILGIVTGLIPLSLVFLWLKIHASNHWKPKVFDISLITLLHNIKDLPLLLFDHFKGYYFLYYIYKAPIACNVFSCLMIALIIVLVLIAINYLFKSSKEQILFIISVLSILFTMGYCLFLTEHAPRYLIPLTGFVLFSLFIYLDCIEKPNQRVIARNKATSLMERSGIISRQHGLINKSSLLCALFITLGIPSLISFKDYTYFPARKIEVLVIIDYLQKHDIKYCFSNDGLLQWQIMFYSGEKIICRESDKEDRYPEYVEAVANAYHNDRQHLAIIDNTKDLQSIDPERTVNVISHFYILLQPEDNVIKDMEFKF